METTIPQSKDKPEENYVPPTAEEVGDIDEDEATKFWQMLRHKEETELRAINNYEKDKSKKTRNFHFRTKEKLFELCRQFNGKYNLYLGVNERCHLGTHQKEVISVGTIPFDIDCVAKPASQEDLEEAKKIAEKIIADMVAQGFLRPTYILSGNGYQLFFLVPPIPIDDTNRDKIETKIESFGKEIIQRYSTPKVRLDNIYDLPRIMRVPGTWNLKSRSKSKIISYKTEEDEKLRDYILNRPEVEKDVEKVFHEEKAALKREASNITVDDLDVEDIWGTAGLTLYGSEYRGPHPIHGSTSGENFNMNTTKNTWHCFRCNSGGGPLSAIAVKEGLIDCAGSRPGAIRGNLAREAIKIAEEKYGLPKQQQAFAVFGLPAQTQQFLGQQPLCYDKAGLWWIWDPKVKYWVMTDEVDILNMVQNATGADIITSKARTELINSLKQSGRLAVPAPAPRDWIQFKNGIVDIKTGLVIQPDPKYFVTNPIPWNMGESEDTPNMDRIFAEWVGKDYVPTLFEILAFSLLCDYPINRIFCFVGSGLNGKSKYLELLRKFVGEKNCCATELDVLLNSRFEITRLYRKLICQMGETDFSELSKTSVLKKLSGGDLIGFEYKNKTPFEELNYAKIIISTNNLPATTDKTIGFYRRWLIIDFPNQFTEKIDILSQIPDEEYENLAKKSLRILRDLLARREFIKEGSIEDRIKRYEDRSNPFDKFWKECIDEDAIDQHISKKKFSDALNAWCKANRFREVSDATIAKHMKDKRVPDERYTMQWVDTQGAPKPRYWAWVGIRFKVDGGLDVKTGTVTAKDVK